MGKNPNRVAGGKKVSSHSTPKTCKRPECGASFLGTGKQLYCTRACKEADQLATRAPALCGHCKKPIAARKSQKWCSDKCKKLGRYPQKERPCDVCGVKFTPPRRGGKRILCSPSCKTVSASRRKLEARVGTIEQRAAVLAAELENRSG